jgi:magnesium chelatase family protein
MREQVIAARERQRRRFRDDPMSAANGKMSPKQIRTHCRLNADAESLLKAAMEETGLSARAHDKILRVSRTIADLADSDAISSEHISEAINYRTLDRTYWQA